MSKTEVMLDYVTLKETQTLSFNSAENGFLMSDSEIYRFLHVPATS